VSARAVCERADCTEEVRRKRLESRKAASDDSDIDFDSVFVRRLKIGRVAKKLGSLLPNIIPGAFV
jgi:hypothetical protein